MSKTIRWISVGVAVLVGMYFFFFADFSSFTYRSEAFGGHERFIPLPVLNKADYVARLFALAHVSTSTLVASSEAALDSTTTTLGAKRLWPVNTVYPNAGAILPFKRIVAYYGNYYSTQMGVLGEYPTAQMLSMLASTTAEWAAADPSTPVIPALEYIAVVAQGSPGSDHMYRLRMPDNQIEKTIQLANQIHGLAILDVQVGLSDLQKELPLLEPYLRMSQVELAIDPEFSMKYGNPPDSVIGTFDASDINYAATYLASIVDKYHLPPKVLIVDRFTESMVTNYKNIRPLPEVEIVMNMDGWGSRRKKKGTYNAVIYPEPVQFTGIKLFYKNDLRPPSHGMLTPAEILKLTPAPIYIQYQ